jgi:hypothetical protein
VLTKNELGINYELMVMQTMTQTTMLVPTMIQAMGDGGVHDMF